MNFRAKLQPVRGAIRTPVKLRHHYYVSSSHGRKIERSNTHSNFAILVTCVSKLAISLDVFFFNIAQNVVKSPLDMPNRLIFFALFVNRFCSYLNK